jgi:hypothetical protein
MRRWFMSRRMQAVGIRLARDLAWRCGELSTDQMRNEWRALTIAVPRRVQKRMLAAFLDESDLLDRAGGQEGSGMMRLCEWCGKPSDERYCDDVCRRADKSGFITEETPAWGWPGRAFPDPQS